MTCTPVKLGNVTAIVCERGSSRGLRPILCRCGANAVRLCDHVENGRTCSAPLCGSCTASPRPGVDLCPDHFKQQRLPL